jgi:hypothetical protein
MEEPAGGEPVLLTEVNSAGSCVVAQQCCVPTRVCYIKPRAFSLHGKDAAASKLQVCRLRKDLSIELSWLSG